MSFVLANEIMEGLEQAFKNEMNVTEMFTEMFTKMSLFKLKIKRCYFCKKEVMFLKLNWTVSMTKVVT